MDCVRSWLLQIPEKSVVLPSFVILVRTRTWQKGWPVWVCQMQLPLVVSIFPTWNLPIQFVNNCSETPGADYEHWWSLTAEKGCKCSCVYMEGYFLVNKCYRMCCLSLMNNLTFASMNQPSISAIVFDFLIVADLSKRKVKILEALLMLKIWLVRIPWFIHFLLNRRLTNHSA